MKPDRIGSDWSDLPGRNNLTASAEQAEPHGENECAIERLGLKHGCLRSVGFQVGRAVRRHECKPMTDRRMPAASETTQALSRPVGEAHIRVTDARLAGR